MGPLAIVIAASLFGAQPNVEPQVLSKLIDRLHDPDHVVRQYAGLALAQLGSEAVDPLIQALQDKDRVTRAAAAYALGQMGGDAGPAKSELLAAGADADSEVRRQATYAMYKILAAERDKPPAPKPLAPPVPVEQPAK